MANILHKQLANTFRLRRKRRYAVFPERRSRHRVWQWFRWLAPGLFVKRWMLVSTLGTLLSLLGLAIWSGLTPIDRILSWIEVLLGAITDILPSYLSGPLAILVGLFLVFWAQSRTVNSITEAIDPDCEGEVIDVITAHRLLNRGPKIVAVGGGTGLSTILRGLKNFSANIVAIVTVADDGGSSGRLRREHGGLPPGDIRNCLAALADQEKLLTELFQYRFRIGEGLSGHSFGNLFLTAMNDITGDWEQAIAASSKVLAIRGKVLPATLEDVNLWAEMEDGRRIEGESNIPKAKGKIRRLGCFPSAPPALPAAIEAIQEADFIVIGPGSLYTSIIPNLLVPEICQAIATASVPRIYICNIMTQPGETDGYSVADHVRAIDRACGEKTFDTVLVQKQSPSSYALQRYAEENSHPVFFDREAVARLGRKAIAANLMHENPDTGQIRHDPHLVTRAIAHWFNLIQ